MQALLAHGKFSPYDEILIQVRSEGSSWEKEEEKAIQEEGAAYMK